NALDQLDAHYESAKQAALADRLVLTKTDLVPAKTRAAVEARLKAFNPWAPVLIAVNGRIAPQALFGETPTPVSWDTRMEAASRLGNHAHGPDADAAHLARAHGIATFTLTHEAPIV